MSRRWFWPIVIAAVLLLSLSSGFLWSILMLYDLAAVPDMPHRIGETYSVTHVFWVDINPIWYVVAGAVAAVGVLLLVLAARLR